MSLRSRTSLIAKLLKNKQYRDAYVVEHVRNGVPFQIRSMRDQREWTQARLGQEAKKPQNVISRLEDPNYGKLTIQTLLEIASAFDTALIVKFVPFSRLLKEFENVSPTELSVKSISDKEEVKALKEWAEQDEEAKKDTADITPIRRFQIANPSTGTKWIQGILDYDRKVLAFNRNSLESKPTKLSTEVAESTSTEILEIKMANG